MRKYARARGSAFRQISPAQILRAREQLGLTAEQAAAILGWRTKFWQDMEAGFRQFDPALFWAWKFWAHGTNAPPISQWRDYADRDADKEVSA